MIGLSRLRGSERYGACDDEAVEWETRGRLLLEIVPEAPRGVQNILTMRQDVKP